MSLVEQLQQLSELHRAGALTEAQFESAKNALLKQPAAPAPPLVAPVGLAAALQQIVGESPAEEPPPPSLQALIDRAAPGDTLTIPAGVHYGKLMISKDLTLQGDGAVLRPPTPEQELEEHAERCARIRALDAECEPLEKARQQILRELDEVGLFSFGKKSKLRAALEASQAKSKANREEYYQLRKQIMGDVKRPLVEIKDARVSLKGLRLECPPQQARVLMSEDHWYALGADTQLKADLEVRSQLKMLRASLAGASHALSMESCTLDGGGMYGGGLSASSNKGDASLSIDDVKICNLGNKSIDRALIEKDVWASVNAAIYIWWGLENKQTRVKLRSCHIHDAFSGIMIHKCSNAALTDIRMKSIATYGIRVYGKNGIDARGNMTLDGAVFTDIKKRSILGYTDASGSPNFSEKNVRRLRSGGSVSSGAAPKKAAPKKAAPKKAARRSEPLAQMSVKTAPLPCEVCGATIRSTQYYFHGSQFSDGWNRGFFCSTSCREKGQEFQHFGSPHEPFRKGDRVRLMGTEPHHLMDNTHANAPLGSTAGNHGEFPGGTTATVVSDLMVVPDGGYAAGAYGDIDIPGKFAVVSIRINGTRYDGVYIGSLELVARGR